MKQVRYSNLQNGSASIMLAGQKQRKQIFVHPHDIRVEDNEDHKSPVEF
jgi:hypothetical protein